MRDPKPSPMIRSYARCGLCAALVACSPATPAITPTDVPTIVLDKGAKEFPEGLEWTGTLVELPDGRVLLGDHAKKLWLIDFNRERRTVVADSGDGPTEILDGTLLTGAADSALFFDRVMRRLVVFTPSGAQAGTRPFGGARGDPFALIKAMQPQWVDQAGDIFGETIGVSPASMAEMMRGTITRTEDSVTIERFDPRTGRTDSIARIRNWETKAPHMKLTGPAMSFAMPVSDMRADDEWTALPDGRVAILRDGNYQVEFAAPGKPATHGPAIAHPTVPVTDEEKKSAIESARKEAADANARRADRAAARGAPDSSLSKVVYTVSEPTSWPATKAPYIELKASPDGRLWVMTPTAFKDRTYTYDVLDGSGALVAHVRTAPYESIAGLGRGTVYTFRLGSTALEHLRRYVLPAPIGRGSGREP